MKSPWKYLVGFRSRRPQPEAQESSIGDDPVSEPFDSEVEHPSALPSNSREALDKAEHEGDVPADQMATASNEPEGDLDVARAVLPSASVEERRTSNSDQADHSGVEAHAFVQGSKTRTQSPRIPRNKRPERPKRGRVRAAMHSAVDINEDQGAQSLTFKEPRFFDEVAGLDDEIKQMKRLLAQKLYLQNLQLKKMLERFDLS
ncbi:MULTISPECIES: hypothetical protein [Rhizobium]|uniref:Uncharacterized protein n=1 Tax=Rhizobium favelukesii TaxID=348824 RepID=W6RPM2_9HYPH|nr:MULTISPECIES: hypothetical protein [Rhizobium]MCA0805837.1 hypothetical protein [Rhizobium sp. T1473]MCS0459680.1 hypothetical protein [Rhizobium favelukesii]UFS80310.1 hypothetical protein LPB79_03395 [Rhizobium sp. T136]CDM62120.1 hypothetical protein LPU83_pLPU83d_0750 [Rhizobium favelukesii]